MGNQSETIDDEMALSNIENFKIIGIMNKDIYDCTNKENGYLKCIAAKDIRGLFRP